MGKYSIDFGNKEFLLNYTNRRWGLTKTTKVGEVMALIRNCQPKTYDEWKKWYFENAYTKTKTPTKVSEATLKELGERLYVKLSEIVIPQIKDAIKNLTYDDCLDYVFNLTINRTYDGFITEKSVINDNLVKRFKNVVFEESNPELDHAGDIDYLGKVNNKAFGLQIKPVTASANLGNYDVSARMEQSFRDFENKYGGKVFIVFSVNDRISNEDVYDKIEQEIERLKKASL
ncbi:MAG: MjaI family restriction endonuclease [Bacteroidales bacterium]|nr:MjaI family restriction endonuclease [Bacteroidales bacterium]